MHMSTSFYRIKRKNMKDYIYLEKRILKPEFENQKKDRFICSGLSKSIFNFQIYSKNQKK